MASFAERRRENIRQNEIVLQEIKPPESQARPLKSSAGSSNAKRKIPAPRASTRQSVRIASASKKSTQQHDEGVKSSVLGKRSRRRTTTKGQPTDSSIRSSFEASIKSSDVESVVANWTAWEPEADEPTRDAAGTYHFESHPDFRPNKSPQEIIREGCFGGSYWRPIFSKRLGITVQDDWKELPASWTTDLNIDTYLISPNYNADVNKYGVACGQSIEEWEAAGWIAHDFDVRGWFQWYCRFWLGRRCADDERQISRWKKCVGETGRWRRILLKKYVTLGIRTVFADDDGDGDNVDDVSPAVHQTCHHWAYEVRQDDLERYWEDGR
jgi:hypothetical protein